MMDLVLHVLVKLVLFNVNNIFQNSSLKLFLYYIQDLSL